MWNSLRFRLTLIFIGLAVIPVLVVTFILGQRNFQREHEQVLDSQGQVAERVSTEIDAYLGAVDSDLVLLAGEIQSLENADRAQEISLLLGALNNGPYRDVYSELTVLDAEGNEEIQVSRSGIASDNELTRFVGADKFELPKATRETYYSPVFLDQTSGEPFMTIAIPLSKFRSVEFNGVLIADVQFKAIRNLITGLQMGASQNIYVIDTASQVVAFKDLSVISGRTTVALPAESGDTKGLLGEDVVFATALVHFGDLGLRVVAERPSAEALVAQRNGAIITAIVTIFTLLVAIGLIILMVRQVVRPIEELSAVARSIQEDNLSARATVTGRDEIGILAQSFNDMTDRLQQNLQNLENQAEELSEKNKALRIATAKAKEASRLKDEFLAIMSHELRTPLNAIIGFQGILGMSGQLNEQGLHMVARTRANADRLLNLINDILDISRIESGRLQLVPVPITIAEAVEKWKSQMSILAEQKGLQFTVGIDESLPPVVNVDEDAISKIITNLLGNAFKFTEQGKVELGLKRANGNWIIEVHDTGVGIPAHMHETIFERFRQVDGSSKRKFGGSGLGLAIVESLCKAMNGTVTVNSEPGVGSTFTVSLPLIEIQGS